MTTAATRLRAAQASDALTRALINAAARGIRPRCGDHETSYLWLSESPAERQQASRLCAGCVVITECRNVGQHQSFGVFGSVDVTRAPGRPKTAA